MIAAFFVVSHAAVHGAVTEIHSSSPQVVQNGGGRWVHMQFHGNFVYFQAIGADPSGPYVWLSDGGDGVLTRVGMDFTATSLKLAVGSQAFTPGTFAFAPDGTMYVGGCLQFDCSYVGVLSPDRQQFTAVSTPSGDGPGFGGQFTLGPDGNMWFIEGAHVGTITPQLAITEYPTGINYGGPNIVVGGDGNLWFDGGNASSSSSGPPPVAGYLVPSTGRVKIRTLTLNGNAHFFALGGGMATARNGRVYVLADGGTSGENAYFDELTRDFKQLTIPIGPSFSEGPYSLIEGPHRDLWFGALKCPGSSQRCAMGTYDPITGTFRGLNGTNWPGAIDLTVGGDGNVWSICCDNDASSDNPSQVLIYVIHTLTVRPSSWYFPRLGRTVELRARYAGRSMLTAVSENPNIAAVMQPGPKTFLVTAAARGKTTIVVEDALGNSFSVPIIAR